MSEWICATDRNPDDEEFIYGPEFLCFVRKRITPYQERAGMEVVLYDFRQERWQCNGTVEYWMRIPTMRNWEIATNADKLRRSSMEELTEILISQTYCEACIYNLEGTCIHASTSPDTPLIEGCRKAAMNWLKRPEAE